jgi:hypothetical protein
MSYDMQTNRRTWGFDEVEDLHSVAFGYSWWDLWIWDKWLVKLIYHFWKSVAKLVSVSEKSTSI